MQWSGVVCGIGIRINAALKPVNLENNLSYLLVRWAGREMRCCLCGRRRNGGEQAVYKEMFFAYVPDSQFSLLFGQNKL